MASGKRTSGIPGFPTSNNVIHPAVRNLENRIPHPWKAPPNLESWMSCKSREVENRTTSLPLGFFRQLGPVVSPRYDCELEIPRKK